jgi:hypothetical protein
MSTFSGVVDFNSPRLAVYSQPTLALATPVAWTTGNSPVTLWTVTGTILCRVYGAVGATAFTSTAGTGTLAVGVAGATGAFIAATTANGTTNFIASAAWMDTAPTVTAKVLAAIPAAWVLCTGNIILTVATNSMTAGAVTMFCEWIPLTAGANVA